MSKSFLDDLDSYSIAQLQEAIAYELFDNWVHMFDGTQFELDYEMASRTTNRKARVAFNNFYNLLPNDRHYLKLGDDNGTNL